MIKRLLLTIVFLLLVASRALAAGPIVLPDACGDDNVRFKVKTLKNQPPPGPPDEGKAMLVLIGTFGMPQRHLGGYPTIRFGLDGAWVGATEGNSYFTVMVAPGEHHLCTSWQSKFEKARSTVTIGKFTAEAGKVYYYEENMTFVLADVTSTAGGGAQGLGMPESSLAPLDDDNAKYRMKAWARATWELKK